MLPLQKDMDHSWICSRKRTTPPSKLPPPKEPKHNKMPTSKVRLLPITLQILIIHRVNMLYQLNRTISSSLTREVQAQWQFLRPWLIKATKRLWTGELTEMLTSIKEPYLTRISLNRRMSLMHSICQAVNHYTGNSISSTLTQTHPIRPSRKT